MNERRNINRGYRKLAVWEDAISYYAMTCDALRSLPYELKRVASQQMACVDSIHRNIAEGYCRRSLSEYLQFLNIALGSLGESVSGWHAMHAAQQIPDAIFEQLDAAAYKLENGLIALVRSLQEKRREDAWSDTLILHESNALYTASCDTPIHNSSNHPSTHSSNHPSTQSSNHPSIHSPSSHQIRL